MILFFIIFLEGYIVLSAELLAIRLTLPFVDNGTDTVSILIAGILMPLAFGYYAGGQVTTNMRRKLLQNLVIAGLFLAAGLSYVVLHHFFDFLSQGLGWRNRLVLTAIYAATFLVTPVYLLGQTVPLISAYFPRTRLPEAAGKILFFSTLGSFLGAVLTTLVLMNVFGVSGAATVTIACIALLVFLLARRKFSAMPLAAALILVAALVLNSPPLLATLNVVSSNVYNTVEIEDYGDVRYFRLNRTYASIIDPKAPEKPVFSYVDHINRHFIRRFQPAGLKGNILILGAGGFTIGLDDTWNDYVFVDIDPDLKTIAEERFLDRNLGSNKRFVAEPARSYLNRTDNFFDLIIIDVFRGLTGAPEHLVTREFFEQAKNRLSAHGIIIINHLSSPLMDDAYSAGIDNTIRSVFPHINRIPLDGYSPWGDDEKQDSSVLYIARNPAAVKAGNIYTDNKNRAVFDKKQKIPPL